MAAKRAKTLTKEQVNTVMEYVHATSRAPLRDTVIVLLSFKAGLRVGEIAGLDWTDVCDAFGNVREDAFTIPSDIAKKGSERELPMHPALYAALVAHKATSAHTKGNDPVIPGRYQHRERVTPNTLQRYLARLYSSIGLHGCTSHSGRRSFITAAARVANDYQCSLKDVQIMAGHKYIDTTEGYIEASKGAYNLVRDL